MCDLGTRPEIPDFVNYEFRLHPARNELQALVRDGVVGSVEHVDWSVPRHLAVRAAAVRLVVRRRARRRLGASYVRLAIDFVRWTLGEIADASGGVRTTITERPTSRGGCALHRGRRLHRGDPHRAVRGPRSRGPRPWRSTGPRYRHRQRRRARDAERQRARGRWPDTAAHRARDVRGIPDRSVGGAPLHRDAAVGGVGARDAVRTDPRAAGHAHLRRRPRLRPAMDQITGPRSDRYSACVSAHPRISVNQECAGVLPVADELGFFRELLPSPTSAPSPRSSRRSAGIRPCSPMPACVCRTSVPRNVSSARRSTSRPRSAPTRCGAPRAASVRARGRKRPTSSLRGIGPAARARRSSAYCPRSSRPTRCAPISASCSTPRLVGARSLRRHGVVLELALLVRTRTGRARARQRRRVALVQDSDYEIGPSTRRIVR